MQAPLGQTHRRHATLERPPPEASGDSGSHPLRVLYPDLVRAYVAAPACFTTSGGAPTHHQASSLTVSALELRVPPVVVTLAFAGLMWICAVLFPSLTSGVPGRIPIALVFVAMGVAVAMAGVVAFRRASTTVSPIRPDNASSLVTSGVYRLTRNPMYVGFLFTLIGWALWLANPLSLLLVLLFMGYMSRFQIGPEEQALCARFGDTFESYARRTRRWL